MSNSNSFSLHKAWTFQNCILAVNAESIRSLCIDLVVGTYLPIPTFFYNLAEKK